MTEIRRRRITTDAEAGVELDVLDAGDPGAPVVVLLHGFPETSHSWRHQLVSLPAAGYRVLAPDQRGYGRSSAPREVDAYGTDRLSADVLALLDDVDVERAVVVGHDWGALLTWDLVRLHPDRVAAAVGVSVPFTPWPAPPTQVMRATVGEGNFFYILYFQQVGPPERELEADVRRTMRTILWVASGPAHPDEVPDPLPEDGTGVLDFFAHGAPPVTDDIGPWLTDADVDAYVDAFEASGFFGPVSWYRNLDANHARLADVPIERISMPTFFIGGSRDGVISRRPEYVEMMDGLLPDHRGSVIIDGAGHWTQQEAPAEFDAALLGFLRSL